MIFICVGIYFALGLIMVGVFAPVIDRYVFDYTANDANRRRIVFIGIMSLLIGWPVYIFNAARRALKRTVDR